MSGKITFGEKIGGIESEYNKIFGSEDKDVKKMLVFSNVLTFALLIIACLGMTHVMSRAAVGWTTFGIGIGSMLLHLHAGNLSKRKCDLISWALIASSLIVVGALGGTGILSGQQVGYSAMTIILTGAIFYCVILRGIAAKKYFDKN